MDIATALQKTVLKDATVVAGQAGLSNEILWVHMVDHPDIAAWIKPGYLLLSTGYNWPRKDDDARNLICSLKEKGLSGVVLAVPNFLEHFPQGSITAANEVGLPLLELPWEIPFSEITEEIHSNIIKQQSEIIERSEEIHRELTNAAVTADSLDDLAKALARLLKRTVCFLDGDGVVLGASKFGNFSLDENKKFSRLISSINEMEKIGSSIGAITISREAGADDDARLACPIRIGGNLVGIVFINEENSSFTELDVRAIEHASIIGALHISHMRALHLQEERLGYSLVGTLLEGRFETTPSALERAKISGWDPAKKYYVCLILLDEPLPLSREGFLRREKWVDRLKRYLAGIEAPLLMSVSLNQITFLLSADSSPESLWNNIGNKTAAIAVSRQHSGSEGIALGGKDVNAIGDLLKPGKMHYFSEVMFPRALMGDASARDLLIKTLLGPLFQDKKGESLLETLEVLCEEGFQLVNSAKKLGVHISTLRYRMERIELVLGKSLEEPNIRFELQVAMKLYRLSEE